MVIGLVGLALPCWLPLWGSIKEDAWSSNSFSFILVFFFAALPLVNALFDWLSVSFTQYCLQRYGQSNHAYWLFWLLCDIAVAFLFITGIFAAVFGLLFLMEAWGWQLDASHLLDTFIKDPTAPANRWILLLVVTNLIPTLIHLLYLLAGVLVGTVLRTDKKIERWLDAIDNQKPFNADEAATCADFLLLGHWERTLLMLSFLPAVIFGAIIGIGEMFQWVLS